MAIDHMDSDAGAVSALSDKELMDAARMVKRNAVSFQDEAWILDALGMLDVAIALTAPAVADEVSA